MFFYVVLNGRKIPIPYQSLREAMDAADEYKRKFCAAGTDIVCDDDEDNSTSNKNSTPVNNNIPPVNLNNSLPVNQNYGSGFYSGDRISSDRSGSWLFGIVFWIMVAAAIYHSSFFARSVQFFKDYIIPSVIGFILLCIVIAVIKVVARPLLKLTLLLIKLAFILVKWIFYLVVAVMFFYWISSPSEPSKDGEEAAVTETTTSENKDPDAASHDAAVSAQNENVIQDNEQK